MQENLKHVMDEWMDEQMNTFTYKFIKFLWLNVALQIHWQWDYKVALKKL